MKNNSYKKRIKLLLTNFLNSLDNEGIVAFKRAKVKRLKGKWKGYYRLRLGNVRIIFLIDFDMKEIFIYDVGFRGNIYQ